MLHTRISEDLAEDLRRIADDLRVPVSNIVRTVLEEAFSAVEKVTDDMGGIIEEVVDEAEAARERIRRRHRHPRHRHHRGAQRETVDVEARDENVEAGEPAAEGPDAGVIGWQPLFLAHSRSCGECGTRLERGVEAYGAVTARGLGETILCRLCVGARRRG